MQSLAYGKRTTLSLRSSLLVLLAFLFSGILANAQDRVAFTLENRRVDSGKFLVDVYADNINYGGWNVGNSILGIKYNNTALDITNYIGNLALDADNELQTSNDYEIVQNGDQFAGQVNLSLTNLTFNFSVTKTARFKVGTLQFDVLDLTAVDSLRWDSDPFLGAAQGLNALTLNAGNANGFTVVNPTVTLIGEPRITVQPLSQNICANNASISVTANGPGTLMYQWQKFVSGSWTNVANGGHITGATSANLTFTPASSVDNATYRVEISNTIATVTSGTANFVVRDLAAITTQPASIFACIGAAAQFSVVGTGTDVTYQWQRSDDYDGLGGTWENIPGATNPALTFASVTAADGAYSYRAVVSNSCNTVNSNVVTMSILAITATTSDSEICSEGTAQLEATVSVGTGSYQYSWSPTTGLSDATIANPTVSITTTQTTTILYTVTVTDLGIGCSTQEVVQVVVQPKPVAAVVAQSGPLCANVPFAVSADVLNLQDMNNVVFNYDFYEDNALIGSTTSSMFTVIRSAGSYAYSVVVTDGNGCVSEMSSPVTYTVSTLPTISQNPTLGSSFVCASGSITITSEGSGSPTPTYQWQESVNGGASWANVTTNNVSATSKNLVLVNVPISWNNRQYRVLYTNVCGTATSTPVTLPVYAQPIVNSQPVNDTVCTGETAVFEVLTTNQGSTPNPSYDWFVIPAGQTTPIELNNGGAISGAKTNRLSVVAGANDDGNRYFVEIGTACGTTISDTATLNFYALPQIVTAPVADQVCVGDTTTLAVGATGTGLTYQWFKNSNIIPGATASTYTIANAQLSDDAQYRVVVNNICGQPAQSADVRVAVYTLPTITSQPVDETVCAGETAEFTVASTVAGQGQPAASIQWWFADVNGVPQSTISDVPGYISGAQTTTLTIVAGPNDNGLVVVAQAITDCGFEVSTPAVLNFYALPEIISQSSSATVCEGDNVSFTVNAVGTGLTYQWYFGTSAIVGATSPTLALGTAQLNEAGVYYAIVNNICGQPAQSQNIVLTVNELPRIVSSSDDVVVCERTPFTLSVTATGTALKYQWSRNSQPIVGATASSYSVANSMVAMSGVYTVEVSGICAPAQVENFNVTVNPLPVVSITAPSPVCNLDGNIQLTAQVTGSSAAPYTFTFFNPGGGVAGTVVSTNAQASLVRTRLDAGAYSWTVQVQDANGCVSDVSAPVVVTVNTAATVAVNPVAPALGYICEGSNYTFTSVGAGSPAPTAQWQASTDGGNTWNNIAGATAQNYTVTADRSLNGNRYRVQYTNVCGTASSAAAVLNVYTLPAVSQQPAAARVCENAVATFTASASVAGATPAARIQWWSAQANGTPIAPLTEGGKYQGVNTGSLRITTALTDNSTYYVAQFLTDCGFVISNPAMLQVDELVRIAQAPVAVTVCDQENATFSVQATGTELTYQWLFNGLPISGATAPVFTLTPADLNDDGLYSVRVAGRCNTITTTPVRLTVNRITRIVENLRDTSICKGEDVIIRVVADGTNLQYEWFKDNIRIPGATSDTLRIISADPISYAASGFYYARVTGTCGIEQTRVAIINVNRPTEATIIEPRNKVEYGGSTVVFEAETNTADASFEWFKDNVRLQDDGRIVGTNTNTLIINNATDQDESNNYVVRVSGRCGVAESRAASLNIITPDLIIVEQPADVVVCEGEPVALSVTVDTQVPNPTLQYQWFRDGSPVNGATTRILSIAAATASDAGTYTVTVTEAKNGITVNSGNAVVEVRTAPELTVQAAAGACEGEAYAMVAAVANIYEGTTYQWLFNGEEITGATSSTLVIPAVSESSVGDYTVTVSNECGSVTSEAVNFEIYGPTVITRQPSITGSIEPNQRVTLTVTAEGGNGDCEYEWQRGGRAIAGATSATYTFDATVGVNEGVYTVVVDCGCGSVTSNPVSVITTSVEEPVTGGLVTMLGQNFPNPFDGTTTIDFTLARAENVRLVVTNTFGEEIAVLVNNAMSAGKHSVRFDATKLATGTYFYTLSGNGFTFTNKMQIVK